MRGVHPTPDIDWPEGYEVRKIIYTVVGPCPSELARYNDHHMDVEIRLEKTRARRHAWHGHECKKCDQELVVTLEGKVGIEPVIPMCAGCMERDPESKLRQVENWNTNVHYWLCPDCLKKHLLRSIEDVERERKNLRQYAASYGLNTDEEIEAFMSMQTLEGDTDGIGNPS